MASLAALLPFSSRLLPRSDTRYAALKPSITRCSVTEKRVKDAARGLAHQAALSARSYGELAALTRAALASYAEEEEASPWVVVAARTAAMHLRTAKSSAITMTVPCLGHELPALPEGSPLSPAAPRGASLSVVLFCVSGDEVHTPPPASVLAVLPPAPPPADRRALTLVARDTTLSGAPADAALRCAAAALADTGLDASCDTAFCGALRARLTAALGSTWGVVACPEPEGPGSAHATPALALPPALRARAWVALVQTRAPPKAAAAATAAGTARLYRVFAFQLPAPAAEAAEPPMTQLRRFAWRNAATLTRMLLYAAAAACLIAYFAYSHTYTNRCARSSHTTAASVMQPALNLRAMMGAGWGGGSAPVSAPHPAGAGSGAGSGADFAGSAWDEANAPPLPEEEAPPPTGCTLLHSRAAEWRLSVAPVLLYGGLGALALLSLLRMGSSARDRGRVKALLREISRGGPEAVAAAGTAAGRTAPSGPRARAAGAASGSKEGKQR